MPANSKQIDPTDMLLAATQACALLRVLANRDRLMLLCQMTQGEFCVSELETAIGIARPSVAGLAASRPSHRADAHGADAHAPTRTGELQVTYGRSRG